MLLDGISKSKIIHLSHTENIRRANIIFSNKDCKVSRLKSMVFLKKVEKHVFQHFFCLCTRLTDKL